MRKFRFIGDSFSFDWEKNPVNGVEYVHELQNLYFALTGNEL